MSDSSVCDNCKREPEAFTTDEGETAYWLRVPKENQDPSFLMSNLEFAFCAIVAENGDKRHPIDDDKHDYWCSACASSAYPDNEVLP